MKPEVNVYVSLLIFLFLLPVSGEAQGAEKDSATAKLTVAAREIIQAAGYCTLITLDDNGLPRARIMDPFAPEPDFTVWLGTNPLSRKVQQIKRDPRVTLCYVDRDASGYVVVQGRAELVDDPSEKEKHWKPEWKAFYPDNKDGYLLIRVIPEEMEVVSYRHGILGDPITWKAPSFRFE